MSLIGIVPETVMMKTLVKEPCFSHAARLVGYGYVRDPTDLAAMQ